jgi:hypothetical protein
MGSFFGGIQILLGLFNLGIERSFWNIFFAYDRLKFILD